MENLNPESQKILNQAQREAEQFGDSDVESIHLFLALMASEHPCMNMFYEQGLTLESSRNFLARNSDLYQSNPVSYRRMFRRALSASLKENRNQIEPPHLLNAVLQEKEERIEHLLAAFGIDSDALLEQPENKTSSQSQPSTPAYALNLVEEAQKGHLQPVKGREKELKQLIGALSRKNKNNPILLGEAGVGKTTLVEKLAQNLAEGKTPDFIKGKQLWVLDIPGMLSGAGYRGEFEKRAKSILEFLKDDIIFIDEIHSVLHVGSGKDKTGMSLADILKPLMARGEITLIGASTLNEYRQIEKDKALVRRFQPIIINEPSLEETLEILRATKPAYETHHQIRITEKNLQTALTESQRIKNRHQPDKSLDIIDETGARISLEKLTDPKITQLRRLLEETRQALEEDLDPQTEEDFKSLHNDIINKIKDLSRINENDIIKTVDLITNTTGPNLKQFAQKLEDKIYDAPQLVEAFKRLALRSSSVFRKNNPASLLLLGPSGSGKTYASRIYAELLNRETLTLDMNSLNEDHAVANLIGAPPGYEGHDQEGLLVRKVKTHPDLVLILEHLNQANPKIQNLLLQILEEGKLTTSDGKKINLSNTSIIMTVSSNPPQTAGFAGGVAKQNLDWLTLEIRNRIENTVTTENLDKETLKKILDRELETIRTRLNSNTPLKVTEKIKQRIVEETFQEASNGHGLKQKIRVLVEDPLVEEMMNAEKPARNVPVSLKTYQ